MERRTWSPKMADLNTGRRWYVVDAEGQTLGRIASVIAATLRGKTKPTFTPHADMGDFVIVVNAEKVVLTGKKETQKLYSSHSGYPGGLRRRSVREVRASHPERIIGNVLGRRQFRKLKVYAGPDHPHATQQPETLLVRQPL
jgi:large subunit ribosomal protein L13